jgi:predicted acetyltransferase
LPKSFELVAAGAANAELLENLAQLYSHDMSEYWPDPVFPLLDQTGRFTLWFRLGEYLQSLNQEAYLLCAQGRPAGFALIDRVSSAAGPGWRISEFFVMRRHRRTGLGRRAAHSLFARHPGPWEVAVMRSNAPAARFWRAATRSFAGVAELREIDSRTPRWDGPLFVFRTKMSGAPLKPHVPLLVGIWRGESSMSLDEQIRKVTSRSVKDPNV